MSTISAYFASPNGFLRLFMLGRNDSAAASLNNRLHHLRPVLKLDLDPLVSVHMENNHVLRNHAVFSLAAIYKHAAFVANGRVVLSGSDADTLWLANFDGSLLKIVLENLVCALSNLSFTIELEATSKNV